MLRKGCPSALGLILCQIISFQRLDDVIQSGSFYQPRRQSSTLRLARSRGPPPPIDISHPPSVPALNDRAKTLGHFACESAVHRKASAKVNRSSSYD